MVQPVHTSQQFQDELAPGTQLLSGQYTIIRFLNSGGFGITYLAKDSLERTVVIKECFPEAICRRSETAVRPRSQSHVSSYEALVRSFEKEARNQSKLVHPNIAGVHQVFRDNETAYMAIDFIEGQDLLDTIEERENIPPDEVERMLRQTLEAVGFIHSNGMLHRDISPDNILINQKGEPVVIDFGAARESEAKSDRAMSMLRVVKEGYSPQEFYLQGGEQDQSSDLYALAATFYHVIKGNAPDDSQARLAGLAQNGADTYKPLEGAIEGYRPSFLRSIDRALSIPPADRFQSVQEWLDALNEKMPVEMKAVPADVKEVSDTVEVNMGPERSGGSKPVALIALVVAAVIGGVGFFVMQGGAPAPTETNVTNIATSEVEPVVEESVVPAAASAEELASVADAAVVVQPVADEADTVEAAVTPAALATSWIGWSGQAVDLPFTTVTTAQPQGSFSMVTLVRSDLDQNATDWLKSGTIIYSVNGHLVVDDASIIRAIQSKSDVSGTGEKLVEMRVKTERDGPIVEQSLTVRTGKATELANGVQFMTVSIGDDKWITKVSRSPSAISSLRVGDVVVSEAASKVTFEGQNALEETFEALGNTGVETALLTIARNGELKAVELPLTP